MIGVKDYQKNFKTSWIWISRILRKKLRLAYSSKSEFSNQAVKICEEIDDLN